MFHFLTDHPTDPAKHIELLHAKWESERSEKDRLTTQIAELEAHYEEDYRIKLEAQNKDADTRLKEMVDKVKLEGQISLMIMMSVLMIMVWVLIIMV